MDLGKDPKAVIAIKKPVLLEVHFAKEDGTVEIKEGQKSYEKGDAIMTGTEGEH